MIYITVITKIDGAKEFLSKKEIITVDDLYISIRNYFEKPLVLRLLSAFYPEIAEEDIKTIYNKILTNLQNINISNEIENIIKNKLNEYFLYNDLINIEGFIKFRLNNYISILVDIISVCAEDYMIEKEYEEFIELLKKYVLLQQSLIKTIEVEINNDNFKLYDQSGSDITDYCLNNFISADLIINKSTEDIILNLLILTAPEKIIINNKSDNINKDFLKTLKKIFNNLVLINYETKTD